MLKGGRENEREGGRQRTVGLTLVEIKRTEYNRVQIFGIMRTRRSAGLFRQLRHFPHTYNNMDENFASFTGIDLVIINDRNAISLACVVIAAN